jgi:hypothetical protein
LREWPAKGLRMQFFAVRRYLPLIGQATIIMNDYPYVKYLLIGILGIFVITSKD